jgi:hypothetical protein
MSFISPFFRRMRRAKKVCSLRSLMTMWSIFDDDVRQQLVRLRARRLLAHETAVDRGGFVEADDDGEHALAIGLAQLDHVGVDVLADQDAG